MGGWCRDVDRYQPDGWKVMIDVGTQREQLIRAGADGPFRFHIESDNLEWDA